MIIKRVKIDNWRAIQSRELLLKPGLNVLHGPNEKGKSTIVEAIEKALYWDHTQKKKKEDNLDSIVPDGNPTARPTIELEMEFGDHHVTITKVVADQKIHRECVLRIRREGSAEQTFRGAEAEQKLQQLISAGKTASELGLSRQGKCYSYLSEALPPVAVEALTIGRDGAVLASPRLEAIRKRVELQRKQLLMAKIAFDKPLCESVKSDTDAARLLKENTEKTRQRAATAERLAQVEQLRRKVVGLDRDIAALGPQIEVGKANLSKQRKQHRLQDNAEIDRLKKQSAARELEQQLNALEKKTADIGRLGEQRAAAVRGRDEAEAELARQEGESQKAAHKESAARDLRAKADGVVAESRKRCDAMIAQRNVLHQQAAYDAAKNNLERIERLQKGFSESERQLRDLGNWPDGVQIGNWRREFANLDALQRDAMTKLQVTLELSRASRIEWCADGGEATSCDVTAGAPTTFGAVRGLRLTIDGIGVVQVNCGATELVELLGQIATKAGALDASISAYGVAARQLPGAFDLLEQKRIDGEGAALAVKAAKQRFVEGEKELGNVSRLHVELSSAEKELTKARVGLLTFESLTTTEFTATQLDSEIAALNLQIEIQANVAQAARRAQEEAAGELHHAEKEVAKQKEIRTQLRTRITEIETELQRLMADGRTDEQRQEDLTATRVQFAGARRDLQQADDAIAALGPPIKDSELTSLELTLRGMESRIGKLQLDAAADRREIRTLCGDDPQGDIDRLGEEIGQLDLQLEAEERKLAALVLLNEVLTSEKQDAARLMAEPLNRQISPWLRLIRGVDTSVLFDPETSRITKVITQLGSRREELPFSALSEGTKGQIGLLVRMTLAREVARHNGGPHIVILDDPLTDTSPDRRPEMFRILAAAAEDLQILFITCHADVLATLPGESHEL